MSSDDKVTLINIKLHSSKVAREIYSLCKIVLVFCLLIGVIAAFQVGICIGDIPKMTVRECLVPKIKKVWK